MKKLCDRCMTGPCPTVKSTKRFLGAWARERRRQLGDATIDLRKGILDTKAMDEALPELTHSCDCDCHK